MNMNDFLTIVGFSIILLFFLLGGIVIVLSENERARKAQARKTHAHKSNHRKHALPST
jgi:cbb3-type cytochrome oxidase subunit 3